MCLLLLDFHSWLYLGFWATEDPDYDYEAPTPVGLGLILKKYTTPPGTIMHQTLLLQCA